MKIAVLGLGAMGSAMALRLLEAGFPTTVWNRSASRTEELARAGAIAASDPPHAVHGADIVITMLKDGESVLATMKDAVADLGPRAIWAQMSTIGVRDTERARALCAASGRGRFVDAPVSGSRGPARQGTLLVLASGPDDAQAELKPVFEQLGRATVWLGEAGAGTRMKLVINAWLAALMEGVAETAALAGALGVSLDDVTRSMHGGPLAAPIAEAKLAKIARRAFEPEFALALATKDVHLALDAARESSQPSLPLLEAVAAHWDGCVGLGYGDQDVVAAFRGLAAERPSPGG